MRRIFIKIAGLLLVFGTLSSCHLPEGPEESSTARYSIVPDSLVGDPYTEYEFRVMASDSSLHASKYIWDFGDNTQPLRTNADSVSKSFSEIGKYLISAVAYDSENNVIGQANGIAVIQNPTAVLRLDSTLYHSNSPNDSVHFRVSLSPATSGLPYSQALYLWDFGDNTGAVTSYETTASHLYAESGSYRVTVSAFYGQYMLAADSAAVAVAYPTASLSDFESMDSVLFQFRGNVSFAVTLPLKNVAPYSFTTTPFTFSSGLETSTHTSTNGAAFDSLERRLISGELEQSGDYLHARGMLLDSVIRKTNASLTQHIVEADCSTDRLRLITKTLDSITFTSSKLFGLSSYGNLDTTQVLPLPSSGDCGGVLPIQISNSLPYYGVVTLKFFKK